MMKKNILLFALLVSLCYACSNKEIEKLKPVSFSNEIVTDSIGNCDTEHCFRVSVQTLVANKEKGGVAAAIADTLSQAAISTLVDFGSNAGAKIANIAEGVKLLRQEFDAQVNEQKKLAADEGFIVRYDIDINAELVYQNSKTASVQQGVYAYTGGAHPNGEVRLFVFDLQTGKTIDLRAIVTDEAGFLKIIENHIKIDMKIPDNQSLREAGYLFDSMDGLPIPVDYAVLTNGIRIVYNPYEIAAYAMGPTDLTIPFAELEKVLNLSKLK
jgi:hypothetical protein